MLIEEARFRIEDSADGTCLMLAGEIDMLSRAEFAAAVDRVLAARGVVALDFAEVTFMDSSGLQVLCVAHAEGSVRLRNLPDHVRQLLALTGLDEVFQIESE